MKLAEIQQLQYTPAQFIIKSANAKHIVQPLLRELFGSDEIIDVVDCEDNTLSTSSNNTDIFSQYDIKLL